jgi:alkylhydroperoxidase family enzyme
MAPYLPPVEKPRGLRMRLVYFLARKQFGKVPTPLAVHSARMPFAFTSFFFKVSRLDKKLVLPAETAELVRAQVAATNGCFFCMDSQRWFVMHKSPENLERLDCLGEYRTNPLFTEAQRAALDYAVELTRDKHVTPETFERLRQNYSEREICDIGWLVASEHLYNVANHGLNVGSDGLCEIPRRRSADEQKERAGREAVRA